MAETVPQKAARLWRCGRVGVLHRGPYHIRAYVDGDHGTYETVLYKNNHYYCSCPWGRIHSHGDQLCAHALALSYAREEIPI